MDNELTIKQTIVSKAENQFRCNEAIEIMDFGSSRVRNLISSLAFVQRCSQKTEKSFLKNFSENEERHQM